MFSSINTKIAFLVSIFMAIALATSFGVTISVISETEEINAAETLNRAKINIKTIVDSYRREMYQSVSVIASQTALKAAIGTEDLPTIADSLNSIKERTGFDYVELYNTDSEFWVNSSNEASKVSFNEPSEESQITDLQKIDGQLSTLASTAVEIAGQPIAFLVVGMNIEEMIKDSVKNQLGLDVSFKNRTLEKNYTEKLNLTDSHGEVVGEISIHVSKNGVKNLTATLFKNVILVGSILVLLSLLGSYVIARYISKPIVLLTQKFAEISTANDLDSRISIGTKDETALLAASFNQMVERLHKTSVSRDYVQEILSRMDEFFIAAKEDGSIETVNEAAADGLGIETDKIDQLHVKNIIPECWDANNSCISKRMFSLDNKSKTIDIKTTAGKIIPSFASFTEIKEKSSNESKYIFIVRDAREINDLQEQLIQSSKLASLGVLGAGVAHELNNPLTAVKGFAEVIKKKPTGEKNTLLAEKIIFASDRMGKIINHLRSYSRQSNETQMKPTGVGEVIENSLILLEKQLELQNIDLEIALGSSIPYIDADSIKLESVIQNLISNSRDSFDVGQMDAKIKIASFEKDNRVGIEISDNGKGIPPEII